MDNNHDKEGKDNLIQDPLTSQDTNTLENSMNVPKVSETMPRDGMT